MLFITHFGSAKAAKDYFAHLSQGDYFAPDAERLKPTYQGRLAERLGINGQAVTQEGFYRLVDNCHLQTGGQMTARMRSDRRAMTDFTFDVPKWVTLAALEDKRID